MIYKSSNLHDISDSFAFLSIVGGEPPVPSIKIPNPLFIGLLQAAAIMKVRNSRPWIIVDWKCLHSECPFAPLVDDAILFIVSASHL